MKITIAELEAAACQRLETANAPAAEAADIAWACAWLECCGYPGVKMLIEALGDERRNAEPVRDALGLDLRGIS